jgi:putative peptidoglycan binding protein
MNTKPLLYLSCFLAITLVTPIVNAGPHRGGGNHFAGMAARGGGGGMARPFAGNRFGGGWNGAHWNGQHWNGAHWNNWSGNHWNNWNWHHHHHHDDFIFISSFGFPFWGWWGYPWYGSYYPYGYPYGYYGGGGYYGNGYYGSSGYGYNNGYANGHGNSSSVTDLQHKLADAGYYHGPIDGIMGSRTQHALRAYEYDRRNGHIGGSSPTLRSRPYSPPPITTEPQEPSE